MLRIRAAEGAFRRSIVQLYQFAQRFRRRLPVGGAGVGSFEERLADGFEAQLDVEARLGRRFDVGHVVFVRELLAHFTRDDPLVDFVGFVGHEHDDDVRLRVFLNLAEPVAHVVEAENRRDVVEKEQSVGITVVRVSDGSKAFLARLEKHMQRH